MTIRIVNKSRRRGQLLAATVQDLDEIIRLLRDLRPGPDRWRESAALQKAEIALARIEVEEDLPSIRNLDGTRNEARAERLRLAALQARRAMEDSRHD